MSTIAIAGASGFVGQALATRLADEHEVIGLSRRVRDAGADGPSQWRACDLFSLLQTEEALVGVDVAVYLVHSMMPTTRLTQGAFEDMDLIMADNFGRACATAGVKQIIYLGGIIPQGVKLSPHLRSRQEVEEALGAHGVHVTSLRAGLVVGPGGSSFQMLERLVRRLPLMLMPKWTRTRTQPIALVDVVELIAFCIANPDGFSRSYDIGGPDVLRYRDMIQDVATHLHKKPVLLPAPLFSPRLSRRWVSVVTGTPLELAGPLVESLRHPMVASERTLQERAGIMGQPWKEAVKEAIGDSSIDSDASDEGGGVSGLPMLVQPIGNAVRSVQRLPRPEGRDALDVAEEYVRWLPRFAGPLIRVDLVGDQILFCAFFSKKPLLALELSPDRSTRDRPVFYVVGGLLNRSDATRGRFEFRVAPDGESIIAAIHDFQPSLPWYIYVNTQALVHMFVMWRFGAHLRRMPALNPAPEA